MSGVPELADYKYGFHEDVTPVYEAGMGLSEEVVRTISQVKTSQWMLDFRLKSLKVSENMPSQTWGADLSDWKHENEPRSLCLVVTVGDTG